VEQDKPTKEVDQIVGMAQVGKAQVEAEEHAKKGDFKNAVAVMSSVQSSLNARGHEKLYAFAGGVSSRLVSAQAYAGSQGYLSSSKSYAARGMGVSKMDKDLEGEIVTSGLVSDFAMCNAAQSSTASAFEGSVAPVGNDLASVVGSINIPAAATSAGAAKAEEKKPTKKSVAKVKSSHW
jgi:hypothetical protein